MPFCPILRFVAGIPAFLILAGMHAGGQEPPRFTSVERLTNQEVRLQWTAPSGRFYRLEAATELPEWSPWALVKSSGSMTLTDTAAPYLGRRYYRAEEVVEAAPVTGDFLSTSNGSVLIHPVNHASLVLVWQGVAVYIDPVGASSLYAGIPKADLILVTHSHGDHFSASTLDAVRKTNSVILVPQAVFTSMSPGLKALSRVLTNGAGVGVLGMRVDAVPAYNANHPRGSGNGYVLEAGGRRLYASGDTGDIPEMRALTEIDVAFLCMNLPFTMSVSQAASAVREFRPRVVYPYHYRNQDGSLSDLQDFKKRVGSDLGIEVRQRAWY